MTLLTIIQEAASSIGLVPPASVVGSSDATARSLLALSNHSGKALARRYPWQVLTKEATHTTLAAESQGTILSIAADFDRMINNTLWNRSQIDFAGGPLSPQAWQARKAWSNAGVFGEFRIRGGNLLINPAPTAGQTLAFEYLSAHWCQETGDGDTRAAWAADSDVGVLDEELLTLDLIWRFRKSKGLNYQEDFQAFEFALQDVLAHDGAKPTLDMGEGQEISPDDRIRINQINVP